MAQLMISLALLLFIVIDPFGNMVPINLLLAKVPYGRRKFVILRESIIATVILLLCALVGGSVLQLLALEDYSLRISGGIILFIIALGMIFPRAKAADEPVEEEIPLVVPIAVPLMAGPSAICLVIIFSQQQSTATVLGIVLAATLVSTLFLLCSPKLFSLLGQRGARAVERLMGILLIMVAVQAILDGIDAYISTKGS